MPGSASDKEASDDDRRAALLHVFLYLPLVFLYLPLSIQAITVPALSKAWKQRAEEQRAKERALEEAKRDEYKIWTGWSTASILTYVPLWAAQQKQARRADEKSGAELQGACS